jgi:hypothetical protein
MLAMIFCALFSWSMVIVSVFSICLTLKKGTSHLKRLHQIPCHNCEYFTNDYRLKCTVNPVTACSEQAIGCIDFEPKTCNCNARQKGRRKFG